MNTFVDSQFQFAGQTGFYRGKVRDVYYFGHEYLAMIASDRISAFDVVLERGIPYKGQVLNQIAIYFLDATADIVPNWKIASPDPVVTVGRLCEPFPLEMIVRGFLSGSAWRSYKNGIRQICGVQLPDGMREHQAFEKPIVTPSTKAKEGHDEDISPEMIIKTGLVTEEDYQQLEKYALALFARGSEMAAEKGLILVDTKYEFGKADGQIYLIDEIHTPDSSRYFYSAEYPSRFEQGLPQKQLSKEFVREWLMENNFMGQNNQKQPYMDDAFVNTVSERYIELYETITGNVFERSDVSDLNKRIENNVNQYLASIS